MNKREEIISSRKNKEGNVSLMLDSYIDIFSSFDPRHYSHRSLSIDFLNEAKRAVREKTPEELQINLLVPENKRDTATESIIKKRLREYFRKHVEIIKREKLKILWQGISFVIFGIILMIIATFVLFKFRENSFLTTFLVVLLEPGGWFLFWEGLDLLIFDVKNKNPELEFYRKMLKCRISFASY